MSSGETIRVALLGSRGVPARYGGYETLMEELGPRLVSAGLDVTVYCRGGGRDREPRIYRGMRRVVLPTIRTKHLDTPVHTLLSCLHALGCGYDAALMVNSANVIFLPLLRSSGLPVALNVDGLERQRAKWGRIGRSVYALSERLACVFPDALVTDADVIRSYYQDEYGASSWTIAYGVDPKPPERREILEKLELESRRYFLYVSRFEPENNPHRVVEAYRDVVGDFPLVMVGGAPYASSFIRRLKRTADARVLFPGPIYGDGYRELLSHAGAYIHATEVGGTHPALVEAMGYGNCVVVNDTPENREVAGEQGLFFRAGSPQTLRVLLNKLRQHPEEARVRGEALAQRAREHYSWDQVARRYLNLFKCLCLGYNPPEVERGSDC